MSRLPTGTVTFLFTDIEGSTRLLHELGERYADVLREHRRILRETFARHGGVEVDTQGDAFFVAFERASDAVTCATAAQSALAERPIRVRMGLHTGEPLATEEGYVGVDVHRAARIAAAGHGGQVLLSQTTRDLVDVDVRDLGQHRLKDMTGPVRLYQLGYGDFPPLTTLDATNLPVATSALIGRERELSEVVGLLQDGHRVVTITGAGGAGKTRLGLQAAAELVDSFRDGVFWVPLAGVGDAELVLPEVAQTLGARDELRHHLRERELLLLLDSAEHVVGAAPALAELLAGAPDLRVLVTSRVPLHVSGEREYPLDPLSPVEATTLFVERARAVGRDVVPNATVSGICERLDNLPLALELAAARTKLLDPEALLGRLERRLPLLSGGPRDLPERQRTLHATIEWSYDLLDDGARALFRRLGVFVGGFAVEAAEEICETDLDTLAGLADASLLRTGESGRLLMLETIREYALERLEEAGETEELRDRHAAYFARLADRRWPELVRGETEWRETVDREHENLHAALEWSLDHGRGEDALAIASGVWPFWDAPGYGVRARRWLERAVTFPTRSPGRRADALGGLGDLAGFQGDLVAARHAFEESLAVFRELDEPFGIAASLSSLADITLSEGDVNAARRLAEESAAIRRERLGSRFLGRALASLAGIAIAEGDLDRARELFEEAIERTRVEYPDSTLIPQLLMGLGEVLRRKRDHGAALRSFAESLRIGFPMQDSIAVNGSLEGAAAVWAEVGEPERAARLAGAAERARMRTSLAPIYPERPVPERVEPAWSEGYAMSTEQAVEYALRYID